MRRPLRPLLAAALMFVSTSVLAQQASGTIPGQVRADGRVLETPDEQYRDPRTPTRVPNYRDSVRTTVATLADYARGRDPDFVVVTRGGLGLVVKQESEAQIEGLLMQSLPLDQRRASAPAGEIVRRYARDLSGVIMDGQYCGEPTASAAFIEHMQSGGVVVLAIDHCGSTKAAKDAFQRARDAGVLTHVDAGLGPLKRVPESAPFGENASNIQRLSDARNILYLEANESYPTKRDWLLALGNTNHDVLAIDAFHRMATPLTRDEVIGLKYKKLGARRLVLARMPMNMAYDTAWYWQEAWKPGQPEWLRGPIPSQPDAYEVEYWHPGWLEIVGRTFAGLIELGFDGVVIEGADAHKRFEAQIPLE